MSNIKDVSRYCSPEVEYLMISSRPHYLPREFSSIFFVAINLPLQTDAGMKTALNELYKALSKQENAQPLPRLPFGKSDHNSILLIPAYKQKLKH